MPQSTQTFSRANTDDAAEVRPGSDFVGGMNLALESGYVDVQRGNVLVPYVLPVGINQVVGSCVDNTGGVIDFVWNSLENHQITRTNLATGTRTLLVASPLLALFVLKPVLGATVLDGLLIYLDGNGELRGVPMDSAQRTAAVQALSTDPYSLHLVPQPPRAAPTATRETNATATDLRSLVNNIAGQAWQFAFQYEYPNGVRTPLGPYSDVVPMAITLYADSLPDPRNFVRVPYPGGAFAPPPLVVKTRLLVRAQDAPTWQVAGDFTAGTAFDFYGTTTGEVLTVAEGSKLFESIPVRVGAMTIARSRVFAGDCTEGYAPTWPMTSLTATAGPQAIIPGTSITVYTTDTQYEYTYTGGDGNDRTEIRNRIFTYQLVSGTYPNADSNYRLIFLSSGQYYPDADAAIRTYQQAFLDYSADELIVGNGNAYRTITLSSGTLANAGTVPETEITLHENSGYPVGVAFYDALGRTAGAEAVRTVLVPKQDYSNPAAQNVRWSLDATTPVPPGAYSYHLLLGPNRSTAFFLQYYSNFLRQYRGDNSDGAPVLVPIDQGGQFFSKAVWISLEVLINSGRNYVYEAGDRVRFPALNTTGTIAYSTDYPVLYERLGWVAISALAVRLFVGPPAVGSGGVGTPINTYTPLVELYRPAEAVESLVLYERGPRYPVLNPDTPQAALSVAEGILPGDATLIGAGAGRSPSESMNPSLIYYDLWLDAKRGRPIARNPEGTSVRRKSLIRFSGVKVQGTKINGLGQWDALSQYDELSQEQGAITRLAVADQTQTDGSILLVTQETGSDSLALGRSQIQAADGEALLAISKQVVGGSNALRGGFGCTDPASLVPYGGKVFWWCRERAEVVRYDRNGNTPLGEAYKFRQRLRALAQQYRTATVSGCYDPRRKEYWLTFIPSDTDQSPVTVVYSDRREAWADAISAIPESGLGAGDELVSWKEGALWRHTPLAPVATFYGEYVSPQVTFGGANPGALLSKTWQSIGVNSKAKWVPTALSTPDGQVSRILPAWLRYIEGVWRAAIRRDELSPGPGTAAEKLHNGRVLQSTVLNTTLTCPEENPAPLVACTLDYLVNTGQQGNQ